MKIKMLTTSCGPDPTFNFNEGQIRDVSIEEARYWEGKGVCTLLEPYPSEAEKAVQNAPEKAVTGPAETAQGKGKATAIKPPVEHPAQPTAEWGKK